MQAGLVVCGCGLGRRLRSCSSLSSTACSTCPNQAWHQRSQLAWLSRYLPQLRPQPWLASTQKPNGCALVLPASGG